MRLASGLRVLVIGGGLWLAMGGSQAIAEMDHGAHSHADSGSPMSHDDAAMANAGFDGAMAEILPEYLKIQAALARDETEGVRDAAARIEAVAGKLNLAAGSQEKSEHYRGISQSLQRAARMVERAADLESTREAFVELSKPISMWVSMSKPENTLVMYCPMKKIVWVQDGETVRNPYGGEAMRSCGQAVGGRGARP